MLLHQRKTVILFLAMLPVYLFGNLHCFGMCGPLAMMLGQHRYRYWYFIGRLCSFSLAGLAAASAGAVLNVALQPFHISAAVSFLFGAVLLIVGSATLMQREAALIPRFAGLNQSLSSLMLRDQIWPTFLFGFFTPFLPCGQTLIVFSACALAQDPLAGWFNGFAFALFTSPSLFFAMRAFRFFQRGKNCSHLILGGCAIVVALFSFCRGLAEIGWIPHLVLNPNASLEYHIIIY
jgi:uncharacterized protein